MHWCAYAPIACIYIPQENILYETLWSIDMLDLGKYYEAVMCMQGHKAIGYQYGAYWGHDNSGVHAHFWIKTAARRQLPASVLISTFLFIAPYGTSVGFAINCLKSGK